MKSKSIMNSSKTFIYHSKNCVSAPFFVFFSSFIGLQTILHEYFNKKIMYKKEIEKFKNCKQKRNMIQVLIVVFYSCVNLNLVVGKSNSYDHKYY